MTIEIITLAAAADLIEASQVTRHDDHPSSVRLDLLHPARGPLTTIQANNEVYLIQHRTQAQVPAP